MELQRNQLPKYGRGARRYKNRCAVMLFALLAAGMLSATPAFAAKPETLHHDLHVRLHLHESTLVGRDLIEVRTGDAPAFTFLLSARGIVSDVRIDEKPIPYTLDDGRLHVSLEPQHRGRLLSVAVHYEIIFDDPLPSPYASMDNPGFGITGTITSQGCFLQAGAGWYPEIPGSRPTFRVRVEAPEGIVAVTAGKSMGHTTNQGRTISRWVVQQPIEGLSLSAGPYVVREKAVGQSTAATYFFPETDYLAQDYLDATARYLSLYEDLFGPYAFEKFAVVENFFPTGYGFPSYTLLGSKVLRLPFIIRISLGHEIAHCWWGNGVYVDYRSGNWSEGLTTYAADYLYQERSSSEDAREYRLQILRDFATLTGSQKDLPLAQFRGRYDSLSKVVGYGKSAMVFHMLRTRLGEEIFWGALRDIYRERLFLKTSWDDFQKAFERRAGRKLETFFRQWVSRSSAPSLALTDVRTATSRDGWTVRGNILQEQPFYDLELEILLKTENGPVTQVVRSSNAETPFFLETEAPPHMLSVDPEYNVFRQLYPSEIPPSINSLKGAPSVLVVLTKDAPPGSREAAARLVSSLGLKEVQWMEEAQLGTEDIQNNHLLLVGRPRNQDLLPETFQKLSLEPFGFVLNEREYNQNQDVLFAVYQHPSALQVTRSLFLPLSADAAQKVAGKITHYGKYSYLVFRDGDNVDKGTWPVRSSPLIHIWSGD